MIDGTYDLLINTPIGDKRGTATLKTEGDALHVDVKVKGFPRQRGTGTVNGAAFAAEGGVKIPLKGKIDYQISGTVIDDLLDAECKTSKGKLHIAGLRI